MDRLRVALRRVWQLQPLRLRGLAIIAMMVVAYKFYGRGKLDYVWYGASLLTLAIVGTCVLLVIIAALRIRWHLRKADLRVPAETQTDTTRTTALTVPSLSWWPLVHVSLRWHEPRHVEVQLDDRRSLAHEVMRPYERGRFDAVVRVFTVQDILGLAGTSFTVHYAQSGRILPLVGRGSVPQALRFASGDAFSHPSGKPEGELIEMRRYGQGDPLRHVLWKAFGRTRKLLVRTPERAIAPQPSAAAYFMAGDGDAATASAARLFIENRLFGDDFVFSADPTGLATHSDADALTQLVTSVDSRPTQGSGLATFLRNQDRQRLGNCIIFAPSRPGPWLQNIVSAARTLPAPPRVIIGVSGALAGSPRHRLARWATAPDDTMRMSGDVGAIWKTLQRSGLHVIVLNQSTGQMMTHQQLEALKAG